MGVITDSLNSSAFEQNVTNPNTGYPDRRGGNTATSGNATIVDVEKANSRGEAARMAESIWLKEVMGAPNSDSRRNNRVRLVSTRIAAADSNSNASINTGVEAISFDITPEINETKQALYAEIGDIRQAASLLIYTGSPSRKWSVNAKFLARTPQEADRTWKSIQLLRTWMNPDSNYKYGIDASGTPHVLKFYGYGRTWKGIPVVITNLTIDYPIDMDYVPTEYGTNVPIVTSVSFQLTEARTPDDLLVNFDLEKFKLGVLDEW